MGERKKRFRAEYKLLRGEIDTTQYPEDWIFSTDKKDIEAESFEEAKELAKLNERFDAYWGGYALICVYPLEDDS